MRRGILASLLALILSGGAGCQLVPAAGWSASLVGDRGESVSVGRASARAAKVDGGSLRGLPVPDDAWPSTMGLFLGALLLGLPFMLLFLPAAFAEGAEAPFQAALPFFFLGGILVFLPLFIAELPIRIPLWLGDG